MAEISEIRAEIRDHLGELRFLRRAAVTAPAFICGLIITNGEVLGSWAGAGLSWIALLLHGVIAQIRRP